MFTERLILLRRGLGAPFQREAPQREPVDVERHRVRQRHRLHRRDAPQPIEKLGRKLPGVFLVGHRAAQIVAIRAEAEELFVSDIGISPRVSAEQYGEIYQEIAETLGELLEQEPRAGEWLRDRTFARTLH